MHFWSYLTQFFVEWEMFQTKVVQKAKTYILYSVMVFWKLCCVWDDVEKYGRTGQATDGNMAHAHYITLHHTACWIPKSTNTHSEYVILIAFLLQQWLHKHTSMLRYIYTLPGFFTLCFFSSLTSPWHIIPAQCSCLMVHQRHFISLPFNV
jgi:hypothetical protein